VHGETSLSFSKRVPRYGDPTTRRCRYEKRQKGKKTTSVTKKDSKVSYKISLVDYHPNHYSHLCKIVELKNMKTVAMLSKDARYICFLCGRAAKNKKTSVNH